MTGSATIGQARDCVARRVSRFDKPEARRRLHGGADARPGDLRLVDSADRPANETRFEAAWHERFVYVAAVTPQAGPPGQPTPEEADAIEVFFDPCDDHVGLPQYGADSLGGTYENLHWPYRDFAMCRDEDRFPCDRFAKSFRQRLGGQSRRHR